MNREFVIQSGVTPEMAKAIGAFIRCSLGPEMRTADATSLINNEGIFRGMIKAAELVESLANPKGENKPLNVEPYSESNIQR